MTPLRGEVWLVNLDPTVGDEIRKMRPAIVANRDALGVLGLRVHAERSISPSKIGNDAKAWRSMLLPPHKSINASETPRFSVAADGASFEEGWRQEFRKVSGLSDV